MRCSLVTTCIATSSKDDGNTAQSSSAMKCIRWRHFDIDGEEGMPFAGAVLRIREQVNQANTGTGLNLWDGAILLAKYLERFPETVRGKCVLELGSGCGMVGIAAAMLGARTTILTDLNYTLPVMKANVEQNMPNMHHKQRIECVECDWFNPPPPSELVSGIGCDEYDVDVILVADCVWVEDLVTPLLRTLRLYTDEQANAGNDGTVWISYQQRGARAHELFW
eukprot:CAMPEP_0116040838 /NCGR_PEP_ID=MMETSP0321-20121206/24628_1 /TAXON_ID=163516 /ORGANISM="Leptocylindrus danicus var. danicus, Strain B650" /LENGTH=222 /DNA_ID=CAMNT_0003520791 /DNA_START=383 /DNA_END=1048 /DNA_ORIENTATION=-